MPRVVGVRFAPATKQYYFDPAGLEDLSPGDRVIVETARGTEMGVVVSPPHDIPESEVVGKLKPVLRRAQPWDLVRAEAFSSKEKEALSICKSMVAEHKLPMKLVRAEYNFDGSRLTFYFTSEKRVDFRALVRDLAKVFKTRIELRQIGVRDEAKLMGGLGCCGRLLCCETWLCEFNPVSIKMAKHQDLSLNPAEISGICGRLLCCLSYEDDFYCEVIQKLPKIGRVVTTKEGKGKVIGHNVFSEKVKIELESGAIIEAGLDEILDGVEKAQVIASPAPPSTETEHPEGAKSRRKRKSKKKEPPASTA